MQKIRNEKGKKEKKWKKERKEDAKSFKAPEKTVTKDDWRSSKRM